MMIGAFCRRRQDRRTAPGACNYGFNSFSHLRNGVMRTGILLLLLLDTHVYDTLYQARSVTKLSTGCCCYWECVWTGIRYKIKVFLQHHLNSKHMARVYTCIFIFSFYSFLFITVLYITDITDKTLMHAQQMIDTKFMMIA